MNILIYGLIIFLLALVIHILTWKFKLPKSHTKALVVIFFLTSFFSIMILQNFFSVSPVSALHIFLFVMALGLSYITTYSAVEVDSPSIVMVSKIVSAGAGGLTEEALKDFANDDILIKPRIKDLLRDNLVFINDGKYKLTKEGRVFVGIFIFFRKLIQRPKGG